MTASPDRIAAQVEVEGYILLPDLFPPERLGYLEDGLAAGSEAMGVRRRGAVYAIRDLLRVSPAVGDLAVAEPLITVVRAVIGDGARPVRGLLFDKNPAANWLVPWHQDLTVCVKERKDVPGFGPWSTKAGLVHVQPPTEFLREMITARIHLDETNSANGALRVLPRTHRLGRLTPDRIAACQLHTDEVVCALPQGGVLLMNPLLLHASSAAKQPGSRRVVHIEYASCELPAGLQWYEA